MKQLTKKEIITETHKAVELGAYGIYISTDNIRYDLDGKGMADYLTKLGFTVIKHFDNGRNGVIVTKEGIKVSTNGFCTNIK